RVSGTTPRHRDSAEWQPGRGAAPPRMPWQLRGDQRLADLPRGSREDHLVSAAPVPLVHEMATNARPRQRIVVDDEDATAGETRIRLLGARRLRHAPAIGRPG